MYVPCHVFTFKNIKNGLYNKFLPKKKITCKDLMVVYIFIPCNFSQISVSSNFDLFSIMVFESAVFDFIALGGKYNTYLLIYLNLYKKKRSNRDKG